MLYLDLFHFTECGFESISASPNIFNSFPGLAGAAPGPNYTRSLVDSPHSGTVSPHSTPQPSPPPALAISNCSPIPLIALEKPVGTVAAYQVFTRLKLHRKLC